MWSLIRRHLGTTYVLQIDSVREYVFYVFFKLKKHDFLRIFEMTYQKVVSKSLVLNRQNEFNFILYFAQ